MFPNENKSISRKPKNLAKKDTPFNNNNNNKFKKKEFTKSTFASRQASQEEDLVSKHLRV